MAIAETNYHLPGQTASSRGSVRDIYTIDNEYLVMVVTDRISAFDVLLPVTIPHKGQVLAQIATHFLESTRDIIPNWFVSSPDPNTVIGKKCQPYKIEVVVRGYLVGHAWREYKAGKRAVSGTPMPDGLEENQKFGEPIITPATHAEVGHDQDISAAEIIKQGLVPKNHWQAIEQYARALFQRGTEMTAKRGLILVDTKYEFGLLNNQVVLIDEVHTPDSSRYFYADGYENRLQNKQPQRQLSKEFVREWLIERGFQGLEGQTMPKIPDSFVSEVSQRYIELYEQLLGKKFQPADDSDMDHRIADNIEAALGKIRGR